MSALSGGGGGGSAGPLSVAGTPIKNSPVESLGRMSTGTGADSSVVQPPAAYTPSTEVTNPELELESASFLTTIYDEEKRSGSAPGRKRSTGDRSDSYFLAKDVNSTDGVLEEGEFRNGLPGGVPADMWETPPETTTRGIV